MTTVQTISMAALTVPVVPVLSGRRSWSGIADDPGDPAAAEFAAVLGDEHRVVVAGSAEAVFGQVGVQ